MKFYIILLASAFLYASVSAETQFQRFELPMKVSIEVPKNWWLLSGDTNTTIEVAGEAAAKLAGVNVTRQQKVILLRANSMPRSTYASITVSVEGSETSPREVRNISKKELKQLDRMSSDTLRKILAIQDQKLLKYYDLQKVNVSGHIAFVSTYQRSGPSGSVTVCMINLFLDKKEVGFSFSYRDSEKLLWDPVVEYMKKSIKVGE